MRKVSASTTQVCGFDPAKLVDFLRRRFPQDTAKAVAAALGMKSYRTVENWLSGEVSPNFLALGQMIELWGAAFLFETMINPPPSVIAAAREEEYAALARQRDAIQSKYRTDEQS